MGRDLHMYVEQEAGPMRNPWWYCVARFYDVSLRNHAFFEALLADGTHRGIPNPSGRVGVELRLQKKFVDQAGDMFKAIAEGAYFGHSWLSGPELTAIWRSIPMDQQPQDVMFVIATMAAIDGAGGKSRVVYWFDC